MPGNLLATGRCFIWRLDMSFVSQDPLKCSKPFLQLSYPRLSKLGALLDAVTQFRGFRLGRLIEAFAFDVEQPAVKRAAHGQTRDQRRGAGNRNRAIRSGPFRRETARSPRPAI